MSTKNKLTQLWAERIKSCQASGINVKTWCSENKVSPSQYYYWIKKLNISSYEIVEDAPVKWAELPLQPKNIDNGSSIILSYGDFKLEISNNIKRENIVEVLAAILSIC